MTREEFEKALDEHRLWIIEYGGKGQRNYLVRRNGATKTWKKDPTRWEVPVKWKFNNTARVSDKLVLDAWFKAQPGPDAPLVGGDLVQQG
jgi:hypothetical protein